VIDSERRRRAAWLFGLGIPAYIALGVVFLLSGVPPWPAYVLFAVSVVDAIWLVRVLRAG
jgi:hypothetical protein